MKLGMRPEVVSASGSELYGDCAGLKVRDGFDGCHQDKEVPKMSSYCSPVRCSLSLQCRRKAATFSLA